MSCTSVGGGGEVGTRGVLKSMVIVDMNDAGRVDVWVGDMS